MTGNKFNLKSNDKIVHSVVQEFDNRSAVGYKKYGQSIHDEQTSGKKDLKKYLQDVKEELMDAILYIQAAQNSLRDEIEECYINDQKEE
jgi:hypothetical protein|tara:strand:+ start:1150 stop:1416 length:267 start_codon:yes stop_codon:yes gene_type:complete